MNLQNAFSNVNNFLLKYPGLYGTPFYIFMIASIGEAGGFVPGVIYFYNTILEAVLGGFFPGVMYLGEDVIWKGTTDYVIPFAQSVIEAFEASPS